MSLAEVLAKLGNDPTAPETAASWIADDLRDPSSRGTYLGHCRLVAAGIEPPARLQAAYDAGVTAAANPSIHRPGAVYQNAWKAWKPRKPSAPKAKPGTTPAVPVPPPYQPPEPVADPVSPEEIAAFRAKFGLRPRQPEARPEAKPSRRDSDSAAPPRSVQDQLAALARLRETRATTTAGDAQTPQDGPARPGTRESPT